MRYLVTLALLGLLLACGSGRAVQPTIVPTPVAMPVPTGAITSPAPTVAEATAPTAETFPTGAPEPTLTSDERAQVALMDNRASSMITAAQDLQQLGQEIRATVVWKGKVQAAATTITAGQRAIQGAALSDYYSPLNDRAKAVTDECAAIVQKLPDVDKLTVAAVADSGPTLVVCIRKLKLLQVSLSGL